MDERHGFGLYWDEEKKFHYKGNFSEGNLNGPALVMMTDVHFTGNFENGKVIILDQSERKLFFVENNTCSLFFIVT